jgi:transcriptional regulator with XRE-family HTH domain
MQTNKLGAKLREIRKSKKLTQAQLAAASDVSQGTIGNIESGLRGYGESLVNIARALGVTPEFLRGEKGHEEKGKQSLKLAKEVATNRDRVSGDEITELIQLYCQATEEGKKQIIRMARQAEKPERLRNISSTNDKR